jgi:hypothetical protein
MLMEGRKKRAKLGMRHEEAQPNSIPGLKTDACAERLRTNTTAKADPESGSMDAHDVP